MRRTYVLIVFGVSLLAIHAACRPAPPGESPEQGLRARVELVKQEISHRPTTPDTLAERTDLVWAWANWYAMTGGTVPVNLPLEVAITRWGLADGVAPDRPVIADVPMYTPAYLCRVMDRYIRELALKEEQPEALGSLVIASPEPLIVGRYGTVEQTWTVGSVGMAEGGALLLGRQWLGDIGDFQSDDPQADDFVSVRCSNPQARFEPLSLPLWGMHGGFMTTRPTPAFRLVKGTLSPGDQVTVVYGDRSHGSRGLKMQSFSTDHLLLPVYLDLDGSGNFLTPAWPGIEVKGGDPERVEIVAPSVVAVGETFDLAVRTTDALHNLTSGEAPGYRVDRDGAPIGRIEAGTSGLAVLRELVIEEPGVYRFGIRSDDGTLGARSNPVWVQDAPSSRIFWGETHGHTDMAEGQGSPGAFYRFAQDQARLDFAVLSEHDFWMDDQEWRIMQELAQEFTAEGTFVAFLGYEWTSVRSRGGHHNVVFRRPSADRVPVQEAHRLPMLYRGLHEANEPEDVLIIPHAHQAADWTQSDPELERMVEIYSCHGTFEWFGNMYLRNGFEVGFLAASDDHRARPGDGHGNWRIPINGVPGLAAVMAPSKTVDAIFDSLRDLRAYATSGQRIILDATVNGFGMGTRQPYDERRQVTCRVMGTAPIDRVDLIRNGEVVFSRSYLDAELKADPNVQVGFFSTSDVFTPDRTDNPRPYRVWSGTLEVHGARIRSVDGFGLDNRIRDRFEVDPSNPNRIRFHIETRGRTDSLLLGLTGASPATTVAFELEPTVEEGLSRPDPVRGAAEIPGASFVLRFADLDRGRVERRLPVDAHVDRVSLHLVDPSAPLDRQFEFVDTTSSAPGDYYYLRVTQLDGGQAWSSPFWVGEGPPQE